MSALTLPLSPCPSANIWSQVLALALVLGPTSCRSGEPERTLSESSPSSSAERARKVSAPAPLVSVTPYRAYGAPLLPATPIALASIAKKPSEFANKTVTVEGDVRRACTKKGCWMEIVDPSAPETTRCRITFKDYGFFVPTDSAGAKARVQGEAELSAVTADYVEHLESEGAHFSRKKPDGSAEELHIIATGVELKRPAS